MFRFIYREVRAASVYKTEDFPRIQDCRFQFFPFALDEQGRMIAPDMVRVVRCWSGHRLDGEVLGEVNLD